jgi:hypothetical protein
MKESRYTIVILVSKTRKEVVHSDNYRQVVAAAEKATLYRVLFCKVYDHEKPKELVFHSINGKIRIHFQKI